MQPGNRPRFFNHLYRLLLAFALCTYSSIALAQELRDAALDKGVMFGSPLFELFDESNKQLFRDNVSVGTVPTYWKYTTRPTQAYSFAQTDAAIRFAEENGWEVHGHPLVWGSDTHIPDWVLSTPTQQGESLMLEHIRTIAGRYRGRVHAWDVVNEAIEDDGSYRNSYWNRAMTGEFIAKAFIETKKVDPDAILLYNDYGIESNQAKFNAVVNMLRSIDSRGAEVDGLGWQLHTDVNTVLSANFPLQQRMQVITDMGLDNYVTELDIRIPENTGYWLEQQKAAYKKIAEIFLRNPSRGRYFQTWGLTDLHTWWDDFQPQNAPFQPLPFDRNYQKKPAYWGMFDAFNAETDPTDGDPDDDEGTDALSGELRIKNLWSNTYLHQNDNFPGAPTSLQTLRPEWYSQRWHIESGDAGSWRIRSSWGGHYLNTSADYDNAPVQVYTRVPQWWSQQWFIEPVSDNLYRLKNRWTGRYLHTGDQHNVTSYPLNPDWWSQLWVFEYID
jgi:endo-1,4-beta-xylanase